jgi:hypothetical protein
MARVARACRGPGVQSRRTDQQIPERDRLAGLARISVYFRCDLRHLSAEALDRNRGENRVEIVPSLCSNSTTVIEESTIPFSPCPVGVPPEAADLIWLHVRRRSGRWNPGLIHAGGFNGSR